jgi:uncharacterized protein (TIGR03086 family)
MFDLGPAARQLTRIVEGVRDEQLTAPTPCPDYALGDLLEHVHGLALAFTMAARKQHLPVGDQPPSGDASRLPEDWRASIGRRLEELAAAWQDEAAWEGLATVAGVTMPAADMAAVAMDEVVVHGWDVARSSGQELEVDDASLAVASAFVGAVSGPEQAEVRAGIFGPVVPVPDDAPALDRLVGDTGRDPGWRASEAATPR